VELFLVSLAPGKGGTLFARLRERDSIEWIATFAPGIQAALQRPNPRDAVLSEEQRHTGAGGFVWSSTVEDYLAIVRQPVALLLQLLGVHAERARDGFRIGFEVHRVAQVDNDQFFASVEFFLQLLRGDARDAQLAQKALAGDKLICDVGRQGAEDEDQEPAAERGEMLCYALYLTAEYIAQAEERTRPEK